MNMDVIFSLKKQNPKNVKSRKPHAPGRRHATNQMSPKFCCEKGKKEEEQGRRHGYFGPNFCIMAYREAFQSCNGIFRKSEVVTAFSESRKLQYHISN